MKFRNLFSFCLANISQSWQPCYLEFYSIRCNLLQSNFYSCITIFRLVECRITCSKGSENLCVEFKLFLVSR